ncbi:MULTISPECIES: tripartite tricarboxylate transporter substrate-binding protein [unclassified Beijerinckia]|uniref:Bug family tripartite tricarboxylate transporter substrate binding protein n=1 Tax=unclassified Beijerinckia TaxID=2638183 RepID=UPI00089D5862|nr:MULTISPECIES: tripartite tricarboxylate transporter substrate-binding protein [unclassified Beijerinckia]MDH7796601.1 tripartite-type tricarboxylate transporter receptor subunit TctC [Beijerinckia sp. GAS462]SEC52045.1 Tripartite-type tricarboxylate transporter, receptor component TctC [Beijerinckia sp. 28-YEA-48]
MAWQARGAILALAVMGVQATPAASEDVADFYKGKAINFIIGSDPGGSFGPYAQVLAEHMPKYIPGNAKIVVKFAGGQSGGLQVANQMQNTAPRDGLTMAMTQQTIVLHQVLQPEYAKYDARDWYWLGNMAPVRNMLAVWHTAKAHSVEAAKSTEVVIGATGPSSPTFIVPNVLNKFAGTKFKIVTGYKGVADLNLAMQRGEVEGRGASWISVQLTMPQEIVDRKIIPIVFASITRDPTAPSVPTLAEMMPDPLHKRVAEFLSAESDFGRSVFLPPGVPVERAAALRKAFEETMKDADFLADAAKMKLYIEPMSADMLAKIAQRIIEAPKDVIELAK